MLPERGEQGGHGGQGGQCFPLFCTASFESSARDALLASLLHTAMLGGLSAAADPKPSDLFTLRTDLVLLLADPADLVFFADPAAVEQGLNAFLEETECNDSEGLVWLGADFMLVNVC